VNPSIITSAAKYIVTDTGVYITYILGIWFLSFLLLTLFPVHVPVELKIRYISPTELSVLPHDENNIPGIG
jgi:hypothetical protein